MPLMKGSGQNVISHNIHELTENGSMPRSHKQIVAIALSQAGKAKKRNAFSGKMKQPKRNIFKPNPEEPEDPGMNSGY